MRGELRIIRSLRAASGLIALVGLLLAVNQELHAEAALRIGGGLILIGVALAVRRIAERRAAVVNERARQRVSQAHAAPGDELALTLVAKVPGPADDRFVRRRKERAATAFVRTLDVDDALEAAGALARMIDPDSVATAKERDRLRRLQDGDVASRALAGMEARDLVVLATIAVDPTRATRDGDEQRGT